MLNHGPIRVPLALAALLGLCLFAAPPAVAAGSPWYAKGLEALGFQLIDPPAAPKDFRVLSLAGSTAARSSLKGKVVLLNFWATWCPPCKAEIPSIESLSKAMKDQPFQVFAVSLGEAPLTVKNFVAEHRLSYPVYLDPTNSLARTYASQGIPTTYLIDKAGRFVASIVGSFDYSRPEFLSLVKEMAAR